MTLPAPPQRSQLYVSKQRARADALDLSLREHARRDLMPDEPDALAITRLAVYDVVLMPRSRSVERLADLFPRDLDLECPADVEVFERDSDLADHVRPSPYALLLPAAEEVAEHVERIVPARRLSRLMPLHAFLAMSIVDLTGLFDREDLIGL